MDRKILIIMLLCIGTVSAYDLPIEGQLYDSSGDLLSGTQNITISLFNSSSTLIFNRTYSVTLDDNGRYYTYINVSYGFHDNVTVSTAVNDDEFSDEAFIGMMPYAVSARKLEADENVDITGYNMTADYYFGDGSQLTNIADTQKKADDVYLYNDSTTMFFNDTRMNDTIDTKLASTTFYPTEHYTLYGTESGGNNVGNLSYDDDQSFNVTEDAGSNALEVYINFTNVTANPDFVCMDHRYIGSHTMYLWIWDYDDTEWELYDTIQDQPAMVKDCKTIIDPASHVSNELVQVKFTHPDNGVGTHLFVLDYLWIVDGFAVPSTEESDPFAIYQDGTRELTADWDAGDYNITAKGFYADTWWNATDWMNTYINDTMKVYVDGQINTSFNQTRTDELYATYSGIASTMGNWSDDSESYYDSEDVDNLLVTLRSEQNSHNVTGTYTNGKICTWDDENAEIDCDYTDLQGSGGNALSPINTSELYNESGELGINDTWLEGIYVPYTGANQNVNLGSNNFTIGGTLFVDISTGTDWVGIGTASKIAGGPLLHVYVDGGQGIPTLSSTDVLFSDTSTTTDNLRLALVGGNAGKSLIRFGDSDDVDPGIIEYNHLTNSINFTVNTSKDVLILEQDGNVKINGSDVCTAKNGYCNQTIVDNATYALAAGEATNASNASYSLTSGIAVNATYCLVAGNGTYALTSGEAVNATYALGAGEATNASNSSYALTSGIAVNSTYALTSGESDNATYALSAGTANINNTDIKVTRINATDDSQSHQIGNMTFVAYNSSCYCIRFHTATSGGICTCE